jgi:hypothetical protein
MVSSLTASQKILESALMEQNNYVNKLSATRKTLGFMSCWLAQSSEAEESEHSLYVMYFSTLST